MTLRTSNQLFDAYFSAESMAEVFCDQGRLQGMLDFEAALARAEIIAEAVNYARDLVNTPPSALPPEEIAQQAIERSSGIGIELLRTVADHRVLEDGGDAIIVRPQRIGECGGHIVGHRGVTGEIRLLRQGGDGGAGLGEALAGIGDRRARQIDHRIHRHLAQIFQTGNAADPGTA